MCECTMDKFITLTEKMLTKGFTENYTSNHLCVLHKH